MKKMTALIVSLVFFFNTVAAPSLKVLAGVFTDTSGHSAEEYIDKWASKGIVVGYNGKFNPDANVTKAEFSSVLNQLFGYKTPASRTFADVNSTDWYYSIIQKVVANGIIEPDASNRLYPNKALTRGEVFAMMSKAFDIEPVSGNTSFVDDSSIGVELKSYVKALQDRGMIVGFPVTGGFEVRANTLLTRAQMIIVLDKAYGTLVSPSPTPTITPSPIPPSNSNSGYYSGGGSSDGSGGGSGDGQPDIPASLITDGPITLDYITNLVNNGIIDIIQDDIGHILVINGTFTSNIVKSEADAAKVLNLAKSLLGDAFSATAADLSSQKLNEGTSTEASFYRYTPTINGIPVLGSQIVLEADRDGVVNSLNNTYDFRIENVDTTPTISSDDALQIAVSDIFSKDEAIKLLDNIVSSSGLSIGDARNQLLSEITSGSSLVIYAVVRDAEPELVYEIEFSSDTFVIESDVVDGEETYISFNVTYHVYANGVKVGTVLDSYENFDGEERPTAIQDEVSSHSGYVTIITDGKNFIDYLRGIYIHRTEVKMGWNEPNLTLPILTKSDGLNNCGASALANLEKVYDYYSDVLGHKSIDNGKVPGLQIHASIGYTENKAYWHNVNLEFAFGKPHNERGLDTVGHEYTHAVIQFVILANESNYKQDGFSYSRDSRALGEAYGDIMGSLIENKTDEGRWLVSEDSKAVKNMANPSQFSHPSHYSKILGIKDTQKNSVIFDYAAYKIMTDSRVSKYDTKTWAKIFYRSIYGLPRDATFANARGAVIRAAESYGFSYNEINSIKENFDAVGITSNDKVGAVEFYGHYYKNFSSGLMTWKDAALYCKSMGGYLASITSFGEEKFIEEKFINNNANTIYYWLGGTDQDQEGVWRWESGEPWNYTNWLSGEPNNNANLEHYLGIWASNPEDNLTKTFWNDFTNDGSTPGFLRSGFICEWNRRP
ncbi:MAG: S-layer homology domain-containing protein [Clostridiales bacterium]|jgi:Zn-dependent metalloprotease|nr:S-layer homology domain-containing protein [Clostridiales bacterium]